MPHTSPAATRQPLTRSQADAVIAEIDAMFAAKGSDIYGEKVTQLQHAVQTAAAAIDAGCDDYQVVAGLLHDVGHLLHEDAAEAFHNEVDDVHEELGAAWMRQHFPEIVAEPARLHVASKRYLCAAEPAYYNALSDASRKTLAMQGGPMSPNEVAEYRTLPYFERAVQLRRFDDVGKDPGQHRERISDYHDRIRAVLMGTAVRRD